MMAGYEMCGSDSMTKSGTRGTTHCVWLCCDVESGCAACLSVLRLNAVAVAVNLSLVRLSSCVVTSPSIYPLYHW